MLPLSNAQNACLLAQNVYPSFLSAESARLKSSLVRDLLQLGNQPGMLSLAAGMPAPELLDHEGMAEATRQTLAMGPQVLQYGVSEGQPRLREALVALMATRGVNASVSEVMVTHGSQQALELVLRALVDVGDPVVTDSATYIAALQILQGRGANIVGVRGDGAGLCVAQLDTLAEKGITPKILYVVPNFSNPSGATLTLERRQALVQWAVSHRVLVIEDDPYGELRFEGAPLPTLYELARRIPGGQDWVCYLSSLSKIVAPGLRLGWVCAPEWLLPTLLRMKQAADLQTSTLTQEIAATYLDSGRLQANTRRMILDYKIRMRTLGAALREAMGDALTFVEPEGGMFLWAALNPPGWDAQAHLPRAIRQGVVYVPGAAFLAENGVSNRMRLNFTRGNIEQLEMAVTRLQIALRDVLP